MYMILQLLCMRKVWIIEHNTIVLDTYSYIHGYIVYIIVAHRRNTYFTPKDFTSVYILPRTYVRDLHNDSNVYTRKRLRKVN